MYLNNLYNIIGWIFIDVKLLKYFNLSFNLHGILALSQQVLRILLSLFHRGFIITPHLNDLK